MLSVCDSNFPFQIPFRVKKLVDFTNLRMSSITLTSLHPHGATIHMAISVHLSACVYVTA